MKRLLLSIVVLAAMIAAAPAAYDKPEGYVSDFAHVVDTPSRVDIQNYLGGLERGTGTQIAVVTVPTLDGEPIEDFANTLMRKWGVGQKGTNEGVLVLFAIQDRKMRIEVGYGMEPVLTDGYVGEVQRSLREPLRAGRYGEAILKCVQALGQKIEAAKGIEGRAGPRAGPPEFEIPLWAILLGLFFLFFILPRLMRGMQASSGYSGRRYRGWGGPGPFIGGGGWGGGGFGGSSGGGGDSSGGFGGFGGGDSGGGGASSDW